LCQAALREESEEGQSLGRDVLKLLDDVDRLQNQAFRSCVQTRAQRHVYIYIYRERGAQGRERTQACHIAAERCRLGD
jgi:hypothetical protein